MVLSIDFRRLSKLSQSMFLKHLVSCLFKTSNLPVFFCPFPVQYSYKRSLPILWFVIALFIEIIFLKLLILIFVLSASKLSGCASIDIIVISGLILANKRE